MKEEIKLIVKQVNLNLKQTFTNNMTLFSIGMFMFFPILLNIFLMPIRDTIPIIITLGAICPSTVIYISTVYIWRNGTLYKNQSLSKGNNYIFHFASFMLFIGFAYVFSTVMIFIYYVIDSFGLFMELMLSPPTSGYYHILGLLNFKFYYFVFEFALIFFAILFFSQQFIKEQKTMYMVVVGLVIIQVIYGGIFNGYFGSAAKINETETYVPIGGTPLFPLSMFWPTAIFFPLFAPSQHLTLMKWCSRYTTQNTWEHMKVFVIIGKNDYYINDLGDKIFFGDWAMRWDILWFLPYIHTSILCAFALIKNKNNKT